MAEDMDSDIETLTQKMRSASLARAYPRSILRSDVATRDGPRRSGRVRKVRLQPDTIPWSCYRENAHAHLITSKCEAGPSCRYRKCKEAKMAEEVKKTQEAKNVVKEKKIKAKKIVKNASTKRRKISKMRTICPATTNVVKCLRYLINRSLKRRISTQSGRFGTACKIRIDLPLSITMFNTLFVHKMKMPVRNVRRFKLTLPEMVKLIGNDWVKCNTQSSSTQVRIAGLISVHHRPKKAALFKTGKCARCSKYASKRSGNTHLHAISTRKGGHWLQMTFETIRENLDTFK